jgi:hypothetical protein
MPEKAIAGLMAYRKRQAEAKAAGTPLARKPRKAKKPKADMAMVAGASPRKPRKAKATSLAIPVPIAPPMDVCPAKPKRKNVRKAKVAML